MDRKEQVMLNALEVAKYFLDKDPRRVYFNCTLVTKNDRTFYEGNAKINKFLHLAQTLHIAKFGEPLISDVFYAYANGAVVDEVQQKFNSFLYKPATFGVSFDDRTNDFLDRVYYMLMGSSVEDLIDLSHEDDEWEDKSRNRMKKDQKMDFLLRAEGYRERFADGLTIMYKAVLK